MTLMEENILMGDLEKKITLYLVKIDNYRKNFNQLKNLMDYFKYKHINFAIVDIEEENLKEFERTSLAKLLHEFNIPYYPTFIPKHTKDYFSRVILKKEEQIRKFGEKYELLEDPTSPKGNSLKFWIDLYTKELIENRDFFNLKIKPQYLAETILTKIDQCKQKQITFIHLGIESTFPEITKILKQVNPKMDVSYLHYLC